MTSTYRTTSDRKEISMPKVAHKSAIYMSLYPAPPRWTGTPACNEATAELFWPDDEDDEEQAGPAKQICAGCGIRRQCLGYALTYRLPAGIWGGLTTADRNALLRAREGLDD
jgi:WhiB family transcriptional regulator, redox-sensing transcriptional regulator